MALTLWVCFLFFLKRTADVLAPRLSVVFRRLLRLGSFPACCRQANVTPIPKGPSSSSVANYRPVSTTPVLSRCLSVWWRFVSDNLWNTVVCFQPPSFLIGKAWVLVMRFCVCHIHCRVHWGVGRRPGLCRSTSALLLIGSTIREFCIGSALWVSKVLCCLY